MKQCSECGRNLKENENDLCPACESTSSHKNKVKVAIGAVVGALGWLLKGYLGKK